MASSGPLGMIYRDSIGGFIGDLEGSILPPFFLFGQNEALFASSTNIGRRKITKTSSEWEWTLIKK